MAIDTSAAGLCVERQKAEEYRDHFLGDSYKEAIRRYVGSDYSDAHEYEESDFANHAHNWLSIFLPLLASGNPRVRTKTERLGQAAAFAKAVQFAVNGNFHRTNVKRTIEQLATDYAFKYCVAMTTPMPVPGMREAEDPPFRPVTKRLSLFDYIWDPEALQHSECRLQGHRVVRSREAMLEEAEEFPKRGWNVDEINRMADESEREERRQVRHEDLNRGNVEFWEIWIPEVTLDSAKDATGKSFVPDPEMGFNGTVFTISRDGKDYLREPRPFWGPRTGLYTFSSNLYVPDETVGLAPLVATREQAEEFNATLAAMNKAIRAYARGWAVGSDASLAEKMKQFNDLSVFNVEALEDITKMFMEVEKGGITEQHLQHAEFLRYMLEQQSGMTEAQQGQVSGEGTATEASIAQMASGKRMGYMTEKFSSSMIGPIAEKEAWYLVADPRSKTALGIEANQLFVDPQTGAPIEMPVMIGGPEHIHMLEEMDIQIEPLSTRYTTELLEAERWSRYQASLANFAPMMPQVPWVDWAMFWTKEAEMVGDPSLARIVDVQKAMMMGMLMTQGMLAGVGQPMGGSSPQPQPRLGSDSQSSFRSFAPTKMKASEKSTGFSKNARPQQEKGPRSAGASSNTHSTPNASR